MIQKLGIKVPKFKGLDLIAKYTREQFLYKNMVVWLIRFVMKIEVECNNKRSEEKMAMFCVVTHEKMEKEMKPSRKKLVWLQLQVNLIKYA